jgi:hypothetical protein
LSLLRLVEQVAWAVTPLGPAPRPSYLRVIAIPRRPDERAQLALPSPPWSWVPLRVHWHLSGTLLRALAFPRLHPRQQEGPPRQCRAKAVVCRGRPRYPRSLWETCLRQTDGMAQFRRPPARVDTEAVCRAARRRLRQREILLHLEPDSNLSAMQPS